MTKMGRALVASTLLGLCIGLMYAPQIGVAGPEHCPRGPNCTCFYPSKTLCVQQLRLNNRLFGSDEAREAMLAFLESRK